MSSAPPPPSSGEAERPDDDDYDLLTYGEAAARIVELLAVERERLAELEAAGEPDADAIERQRARIVLLEQGDAHYKDQRQTAETFLRRFGLNPRPQP